MTNCKSRNVNNDQSHLVCRSRLAIRLVGISIALLCTLDLSSCKTTQSEIASAQLLDCSSTTKLNRTLALLAPAALPTTLRQCLATRFQQDLDTEKKESNDIRANDNFDVRKTADATTHLGDLIYTRNNVIDKKVYIGGAELGKAHRDLIGAAHSEVLLQTFVWESDSLIATEILRGLKDLEKKHKTSCAACAPIVVRMIANFGPTIMSYIAPITGDRNPEDYGAALRDAVSQLQLDPKVIDVTVLTYTHKAFGTNHVKSLVVDGQIALVTGANAQHFNDPAIGWHDSAYIVAGEVARGLRTDVINNLIRAKLGTEKDGDAKMASLMATAYDKKFADVLPVKSLMQEPFSDPAGIPVVITGRNALGIPSTSNNNGQNRAFQALFYGAQKSIKVQSPNFNDDAAIRALGSAVRRGVKVQMVLSKLFNCLDENKTGQGGQNEIGINRLLGEFGASAPQGPTHDVRWYAMLQNGTPTIVYDNPTAKDSAGRPHNSHIKFTAIDDEVVVVGSANMDTQSWNQSRELNLVIFHPGITQAWLSQVFDKDFALARPVTAAELDKQAISCDLPK